MPFLAILCQFLPPGMAKNILCRQKTNPACNGVVSHGKNHDLGDMLISWVLISLLFVKSSWFICWTNSCTLRQCQSKCTIVSTSLWQKEHESSSDMAILFKKAFVEIMRFTILKWKYFKRVDEVASITSIKLFSISIPISLDHFSRSLSIEGWTLDNDFK